MPVIGVGTWQVMLENTNEDRHVITTVPFSVAQWQGYLAVHEFSRSVDLERNPPGFSVHSGGGAEGIVWGMLNAAAHILNGTSHRCIGAPAWRTQGSHSEDL